MFSGKLRIFRAAPSIWGEPSAFRSTPAESKLSLLKWYLNVAPLKTKTLKVAETISFHFSFISKSKLQLTGGTLFFFFPLGWSGKPV